MTFKKAKAVSEIRSFKSFWKMHMRIMGENISLEITTTDWKVNSGNILMYEQEDSTAIENHYSQH